MTYCKKVHNKYSGFTLLEVMVSILIMAVALVSIFKMHSATMAMNASAKFYTIAPLLAQEKISMPDTALINGTIDDSGDFGENFPGYAWELFADNIESELVRDVSSDLIKIDITISFNNTENIYKLRTYRFVR